MDSDRYTANAKPEAPQIWAMLLEDRFTLKVHRESKEVSVYASLPRLH